MRLSPGQVADCTQALALLGNDDPAAMCWKGSGLPATVRIARLESILHKLLHAKNATHGNFSRKSPQACLEFHGTGTCRIVSQIQNLQGSPK